jgi:predicted nucleotidyltransferase
MVNRREIEKLAEAIAREFQPQRIILFGSYAYGKPRPDSDVDLLVIKPLQTHSAREALQILDRVKPRFGVDLVVRSPEDVRNRLAWHDAFLEEITREGTVLYDAAD